MTERTNNYRQQQITAMLFIYYPLSRLTYCNSALKFQDVFAA